MKKDFTHLNPELKGIKEEVVVPSERTINLLKQFARSYFVDKSLPQNMNGFCLN